MSALNQKQIEERLRPEPVTPPDGLDTEIKSEIPERRRVVAFPPRSVRGPGRYALAATIALALIAGGLVYWLRLEIGTPGEEVALDAFPGVERVVVADPAEGLPTTEPLQTGEPVPTTAETPEQQLSKARAKTVPLPTPEPDIVGGIARDISGEAVGTATTMPPAREPTPAGETAMQRLRELHTSGLRSEMGEMVPRSQRPLAMADRPHWSPSTGGTSEPNDQPYGDMFFKSWGVNPFIDTEDDNLSTFGLDVDTGSYTMARSYIERGYLPPPEAVRVEELINYFDYDDPAPNEGDFAIRAEAAPSPFGEGPRYHLVRFGLKGREIRAENRKPATLVFTVDVSGSMERENRLGLVKRSLELLLEQLRPDDRVGLVVYGSRGEVLLEPTADHESIRAAIDRLRPAGSTNAEEGLLLAYGLAERFHRPDGINRVILCSDGVANVGRTGPESLLKRIETATEGGIELTTVGFGMGNYNDLLMEQLADRGDGSHAYVDTLDEARRVFVENLTGTLQTIASEAKAQVEFDPEVVARYRLLGYENRDIADERFRDDTVDAGEVGAGHSVVALYEVKLHEGAGPDDVLATLHLRYESRAEGRVVEIAEPIRVAEIASSWEAASPALRLASLVAEYGEILRQSYWAKEGDLVDLFERAQRISADYPGDVEVASFASLVGRAARLQTAD